MVLCSVAQSHLILCNPMDGNPPVSSVHGILQARILEWVATSYSRRSSWPRDWTQVSCVSCTAGRFFSTSTTWKTQDGAAAAAKSLRSCPTLCNSIDDSPPGFSLPGILQARILEWVAISFSKDGTSAPQITVYVPLNMFKPYEKNNSSRNITYKKFLFITFWMN